MGMHLHTEMGKITTFSDFENQKLNHYQFGVWKIKIKSLMSR